MKQIAIVIAWLAALAGPVRAEDDAKKVQESLQGEWKAVEVIKGGKPELKEDVGDMGLVFKGNTMWFLDKPKEKATFALDPKANPSAIDIKPVGEDFMLPGIYKLEKDKLTVCFVLEGKGGRPKEFKSDKGSDVVLFILERAKK